MKPPIPPRFPPLNSPAPGWMAVSRGAALGLAFLLLLNLLEVLVHSTSAVENWFCSLRPLTQPICVTVLVMAAMALLMFTIRPALPGPVWFTCTALVVLLAGFCGRELSDMRQSVPEAEQATAMARPLGIAMLLSVAGLGIALGNARSVRGRSSFLAILFSSLLTTAGFAVVTIQSGGISDALPQAESPVILVFGCQLENAGLPVEALADRVNTASKLLLGKHGKRLLLSGRQDDGSGSETDAMQNLAKAAGVPDTVVLSDRNGRSTAESIRFAASLPEFKEDRRVIAVSHWYQLARIRLLARRSGLTVVAVPADQKNALFRQNILVGREVVELMITYLEPALAYGRGLSRSADVVGEDQQNIEPQ